MSYPEQNSEEIQAVIINQDIVDGITTLANLVNDETIGVEIDPLNLTCQKTGHIIGRRDANSLFSLAKIYGKSQFSSVLYHAVSLNTHPSWIFTEGESLDVLIDADPIGYACYCFSLICEEFFQNSRHKNQDKKKEPWIERHWAMARANALLTARGVGELGELNAELCSFLTYAPDTKSYFFRLVRDFAKSPDTIAVLAVSGELSGILRNCTTKALNSIGRANYAISGYDIVDHRKRLKKQGIVDEIYRTPADAARGPSNIRKQRKSTRNVRDAGLFAELAKLFDTHNPIGTYKTSDAEFRARMEKRMHNSAVTEDVVFADLSALAELNLDDIIAPNEADDNEVEVRNLSNAAEGHSRTKPQIIMNDLSNPSEQELYPRNRFLALKIWQTPHVVEQRAMTAREKLAILRGK